jgi:protein-disulfide isomerase
MHELKPPVNDNDKQTGNIHSGITLVEYGDYQCPYCGMAHPVLKQLLETKGNVIRFVFRNFPMQSIHQFSMTAALAAEAAAKQNKFWPMHDLIYENQELLSNELLSSLAQTLNLNLDQFQSDINSPSAFGKVNADFKSGLHSGVNGTPSFFINNIKIELPDLSYDAFLHALEGQGTSPPQHKPHHL